MKKKSPKSAKPRVQPHYHRRKRTGNRRLARPKTTARKHSKPRRHSSPTPTASLIIIHADSQPKTSPRKHYQPSLFPISAPHPHRTASLAKRTSHEHQTTEPHQTTTIRVHALPNPGQAPAGVKRSTKSSRKTPLLQSPDKVEEHFKTRRHSRPTAYLIKDSTIHRHPHPGASGEHTTPSPLPAPHPHRTASLAKRTSHELHRHLKAEPYPTASTSREHHRHLKTEPYPTASTSREHHRTLTAEPHQTTSLIGVHASPNPGQATTTFTQYTPRVKRTTESNRKTQLLRNPNKVEKQVVSQQDKDSHVVRRAKRSSTSRKQLRHRRK